MYVGCWNYNVKKVMCKISYELDERDLEYVTLRTLAWQFCSTLLGHCARARPPRTNFR